MLHRLLPVALLTLLSPLCCTHAGPSSTQPTDGGLSFGRPSEPAAGKHARSATGPSIQVLTYNVNYGLDGDPAGVEAIAQADADIVLLQETTPAWAAALRATLESKYAHMAFRDCCGAGGMAVLSRYPFVEKDYVRAPEGWFPAWRLLFDSPLGSVQVLNLHLHPQISSSGSVVSGHFTTPAMREAEMVQYHTLLEPSLPTLVVGDFNEDHDGGALSYLAQRGFRSAQSELAGGEPTWHWRTSVGTIHAEFDHLVHNGWLEPLDVRVISAGRSDHWPVLGVFRAASPG